MRANRYHLDLTECVDCGLLQVTNLPPIEEVFHAEYRYSSSTIPDLVSHFTNYADFLVQRLPKGAKILEFGCNDGVLLTQLRERGFVCVGVDASDNVASLARAKGLEVHTGFLTPEFVRAMGLNCDFDLITCSNVFAHIHDIESTMIAIKLLLKQEDFSYLLAQTNSLKLQILTTEIVFSLATVLEPWFLKPQMEILFWQLRQILKVQAGKVSIRLGLMEPLI
jgi:2-polyprenyl-3-methyl-5-hydroxy-6-metoxy-1,4-benzoquinol methylase